MVSIIGESMHVISDRIRRAIETRDKDFIQKLGL